MTPPATPSPIPSLDARARSPHAMALIVLVAITALFWVHRVYLDPPERVGLESMDMVQAVYPWTVWVHRELRDGNIPIWNPHGMAGHPHLGYQISGLFYPPTLVLTTLFSPERSIEIGSLLHILLAGWFTWLFAGQLGLGFVARLLAAAGYMLSGALLYGLYIYPYLLTNAWLPALLWAVHGLLVEPRFRRALALAAVLSMSFLAGHAQGFMFSVQLGVAYGIFGLFSFARDASPWRVIGLGVVAGILVIGLTAPQLLPALEFAAIGSRDLAGHDPIAAGYPSHHPSMLLKGLLGRPIHEMLGTPNIRLASWFDYPMTGPVGWSVTVPALTLPLALAGWWLPRLRRHLIFFLALALVVGLLLVGPDTPLFGLYYSLPIGNLFRGPMRLDFIYIFLMSLVAAIGYQAVADRFGLRSHEGGARAVVSGGLALLLFAGIYVRTELTTNHPSVKLPEQPLPEELVEELNRSPGGQRIYVEEAPNTFTTLRQIGPLANVMAVPMYAANLPGLYKEFFRPDQRKRPDPWHGEVSVLRPIHEWSAEELIELLDFMSVRYYGFLPPPPARELSRSLTRAGGAHPERIGDLAVIERPAALPRAYTVDRTVRAPSVRAALETLLDERFARRSEAVILAGANLARVPVLDIDAERPTSEAAPGSASITGYETEQVVIEAECGDPCLLVLSDLFYPGWIAEVDGAEREILQVNAIFRGVELEPGAHRVIFRYEPGSLRAGLAIFAVTVVGLSGFGIVRSRRVPAAL